MIMIKNKSWFTGNGFKIDYESLIREVSDHVKSGGSVFIGTDSQMAPEFCTFASVICLHNRSKRKGGRYFFSKSRTSESTFKNLKLRIMSEVHSSIEIGLVISEMFPDADIEIHVDIGSGERSRTRRFVDEFSGWVKSTGLKCKIKPESWASFAVADKHTK